MSPRHHNDKKEIQDSTTDFFLKVIKKEKEKQTKENTIKESTFSKQSKTIDTVGRFYNYINQTVDKILSSKASVMILALIMASILFIVLLEKIF